MPSRIAAATPAARSRRMARSTGGHVICDCHGSEFDLRTGAVVRPPAVVPIATFSVRIADGRVEVEV